MTQNKGNHELEDAIRAVRLDEPTAEEIRTAASRVMQKLEGSTVVQQPEIIRGCEDIQQLLPGFSAGELSANRAMVVEAHLRDCVSCRLRSRGLSTDGLKWAPAPTVQRVRRWNPFVMAAAAAVLVIGAFFINNAYLAIPAGARATVQSVDGVAYKVMPTGDQLVAVGAELNEGDLLRTAAGGHVFVKLYDGSLVEVRERSEFSVQARGKDATIAMGRGAVIVQAAKRTSGHLYVKTPDCRVAVTGTVFSVNSGIKGSRVSVVEGTVDVAHAGEENILHAGDQVSTGSNMESVSVQQDIAWSRDLPKHLELLAQFTKLQHRLEAVQMPAPRFQSALLDRIPADAVFFASLPNAGQALEDANRIMQEQIQQSPELREWWSHGNPNGGAEMNEMVTKLRALSDYLGDEIVVVGLPGKKAGVAVVANVRRSDIQSFLQTQFSHIGGHGKLVTITEKQLHSIPDNSHDPIALVRQNEVVFGADRDALERVNAQLNAGSGGLSSTEFGKRLQEAYDRGAGFLIAADLHRIIASDTMSGRGRSRKPDQELARSGFGDMRYLILEHREINGTPDNRMVIDFAGERRGMASWLAAPAPMGSLEFVSRSASVAVAFVGKDPQLMLNDILDMAPGDKAKQQAEMADTEAKLNLRIREDIVAHFGGDGAFALDGPVLPTPSWKAVIEVHDAAGLADSLTKLTQALNHEAESKGKPGVEMKTEDVNGQRYYTVQGRDRGSKPMYFTFAAGYMILGPNRAVLMNTLRTRTTGDSLARSGEFKALLPKDQNANYSAIAYQNLGPILQPLLSQMSGDQAKVIQQLAADSRPSVICAWGRQNQIEAVTNSRLFGFDWMAVGSLLNPGTSRRQNP
jgi:hypothetical protein